MIVALIGSGSNRQIQSITKKKRAEDKCILCRVVMLRYNILYERDGGQIKKSLLWGRFGYFMEGHHKHK